MKMIDLMYRTMFAELVQRSLDASFETDFSTSGNFVRVPVKGRYYWYFEETQPKKIRKYVGPADDPEIARRVESFQSIKDDLRGRRKLVSTLTREAGLAGPDRFTGDVVAAMGAAGIFRLRGVLVGTVAFQTYAGHLGVRLPGASLQTGDADFAQHYSASSTIEDSLPPVIDILKSVDATFRAIPHRSDPHRITQFENAARYRVEFLTPNRGSDDYADHASPMPALGGASAQPLRFLDFLIHEPVRTVMLHRSGVPVIVPSPERYAVHKLIVASRRQWDVNGIAKREKDVYQASLLIEALEATRRQEELAEVFAEAWGRGQSWRAAIQKGLSLLPEKRKAAAKLSIGDALSSIGAELEGFTDAAVK
ncbi:GSU2403 family nucleotidyltransferase fold protein [Sinorhizobium numidicum]|uniref:GSU2403 family nucleotidyltransferase fold protein n=1 Tax=Sinorhizobium numidicum TaxID=680248 RepID=A0ABY8CQ84_9HYPH|nr:GSU2403 family nucleotidyltransferase fold protein [Sinorhizobium numidicum]WEX74817.1 GSU2403 family nucleotidyltransferase fold protein [Sinorhizobium numidicum]WEX80810.1 GSU2403 family nucleotidyltransferase fold protein [Sinorhizobium numidicum]